MVVTVIADPNIGQHDDRAWGREQGNLNLIGKFIASLPKTQTTTATTRAQQALELH